jgi:hypothetical protein
MQFGIYVAQMFFVTTDQRMDVRSLSCAAGEFDTVLDKGAC